MKYIIIGLILVFISIIPAQASYEDAITRYSKIEQQGGFPRLMSTITIKKGVTNPDVWKIRKRLVMEGDLAPEYENTSATMDKPLVEAVKRFQKRYGIKIDGQVGRETKATMRIPPSVLIRKLKQGQREWNNVVIRSQGKDIVVNIPAYDLRAYDSGRLVLQSRVIVGQIARKTPEITVGLASVTINPYWTVPSGIERKDIIPMLAHDLSYAQRKGLRILSGRGEVQASSVNWKQYVGGTSPYTFRQDPGPGNALGRLRFNIPNKYTVFLHDTPGKYKFNKTNRTLSSGCVRVEQSLALAEWVSGRSQGTIQSLIDTNRSQNISVQSNVLVKLIYVQTWIDEDGLPHFSKDIYNKGT